MLGIQNIKLTPFNSESFYRVLVLIIGIRWKNCILYEWLSIPQMPSGIT